VYLSGGRISYDASLLWMNRQGKTSPLRAAAAYYRNPQFAPDGSQLALDIYDGKQDAVWIYDWVRDTLSRLTPASANSHPTWTPDVRRIVFESKQETGLSTTCTGSGSTALVASSA
jgi:Tol biopolymer transport system component